MTKKINVELIEKILHLAGAAALGATSVLFCSYLRNLNKRTVRVAITGAAGLSLFSISSIIKSL